jgi:hypothetical protein
MYIAAAFPCMNSSWTVLIASTAGTNRTVAQTSQVLNPFPKINSTSLYNASVSYHVLTISQLQLVNVINPYGWPPLANASLMATYGIPTFNVCAIK